MPQALLNLELDMSKWQTCFPEPGLIPRQTNIYDCGVFALAMARSLAMDERFNISQEDAAVHARMKIAHHLATQRIP